MTEEDRNLLLDVKAMLTSGAWGNEHSIAPLLGNTKQRWRGRTVTLVRGPFVIQHIAAGTDLYEHWEEVFELVAFDLEEDMIMAYFHPNYTDSKYETKLYMLTEWAKSYYMKTLEESL